MPFQTDKDIQWWTDKFVEAIENEDYSDFIGNAEPMIPKEVANDTACDDEDRSSESCKPWRDCSKTFSYPGPSGRVYRYYPPSHPYPSNFPKPMGTEIRDNLTFYYMSFDEHSSLTTRIFTGTVGARGYAQSITDWIKRARQNSWVASDDIEEHKWKAPGRLAFFLDDPAWALLDLNIGGTVFGSNSLHFAHEEAPKLVLDKEDQPTSNESFFNARNEQVLGGSTHERFIIVDNYHLTRDCEEPTCVRPRKKSDKPDNYKYDLYYRAAVRGILPKDKRLTIVIDPGGRNTGP